MNKESTIEQKEKKVIFTENKTQIDKVKQRSFEINNISKEYTAEIIMDSCDDQKCEGKGSIKLIEKKTRSVFQTFTSDDLIFDIDSINVSTDRGSKYYNEDSPLIFDDFNFDGTEDLAIRNGHRSGYGGPSWDVYVYNSTRKQFVLSKELTELAVNYLGMFQTDHKRKRLITNGKSGWAWHITTEYEVVPKKGLLKVYELEEDGTKDDENMIVTLRKLINNKWTITTKIYKDKDYENDYENIHKND